MLELNLFNMLSVTLGEIAPLRGLTNTVWPLRYQANQQGRPDGRAVWMDCILHKPRGWPAVKQHGILGQGLARTEVQAMETTIQFSVTQATATTLGDLTHTDVLTRVMRCVQSRPFMEKLLTHQASVLRVDQIRTPKMSNDKGNWEQNPSFDLVVKHEDVYVDGVPQFDSFEFRLIRVPDLAA